MGAVRLSVDAAGLSGLERNLLENNSCSALLEMKCVFEGESVEIVYNSSGMKTLDQVLAGEMAGPVSVLEICSDFLQAVRICEDYLLTEKDLSFDNKDIFFSGDMAGVRLKYYPRCGDDVTVREKLAGIADEAMDCQGDLDGIVELMSVYKKRLCSVGEYDINDLLFITGQCARTYQDKRSGRWERPEVPAAAVKEEREEAFPREQSEAGILQKVIDWIEELFE